MGNRKQKWLPREEEALLAGVAKHGPGKWKNIIRDPEFAPFLTKRNNVDLKVLFRFHFLFFSLISLLSLLFASNSVWFPGKKLKLFVFFSVLHNVDCSLVFCGECWKTCIDMENIQMNSLK